MGADCACIFWRGDCFNPPPPPPPPPPPTCSLFVGLIRGELGRDLVASKQDFIFSVRISK